MKPYGAEQEGPGIREYPDKADISALGLPTRYGDLRSKSRRAARRVLKKAARRAGKNQSDRYWRYGDWERENSYESWAWEIGRLADLGISPVSKIEEIFGKNMMRNAFACKVTPEEFIENLK